MNYNYLQDSFFLSKIDNQKLKTSYTKIIILNKEEMPLETIQGKVSNGSLNLNGSSSVRRTGSITFLAEEKDNNLQDINNILSMNKRIKILIGFENNINSQYDKIIWFPLGIFIITQPNITHSLTGVTISLSFKDKMCLLNGECGGGLPASVVFHEYDQLDSKGKITSTPQRIYDIIQTLVCNYGGEPISKIFINDVDLEIKQIVRWTSNKTLYLNTKTSQYTTVKPDDMDGIISFEYNEDIGYVYTDFVYPGELVSGIGENVCSILDKIKNTLGNYEYFYDIEGNFVFQEIKNYLNNSYDVTDSYRLDNGRRVELNKNGLAILNDTNYAVDFNSINKSVYTFEEGNGLISSYTNSPIYTNIKNDFHIWGKNEDGLAIHYHLVIKEKPVSFNTYKVLFLIDEKGEYTGKLRLLTLEEDIALETGGEKKPSASVQADNKTLILENTKIDLNSETLDMTEEPETYVDEEVLNISLSDIAEYTPSDWRAELYLRGLEKRKNGIRPDIYEQELLDLFDSIYNFKEKEFKMGEVENPNNLLYFIDYLEPANELHNYSVDTIDTKIYSYQQDKINKLYLTDIPNIILVEVNAVNYNKIIERCELEGQAFSNIAPDVYKNIAIGTTGYAAQETAREMLYQYTNYSESITMQSMPIYYLEPNTRITVNDKASNIYGDYIINSISLPLDASKGIMSIQAKRALERI